MLWTGLIVLSALLAAPVSEDLSHMPSLSAASENSVSSSLWRRNWHCGKKGLTYDPEEPTTLWIGIRLQTRFDYYPCQTPRANDLRLGRESELNLNRGRYKPGGALAADWFAVSFECDQPGSASLDLRTTFKLSEAL